MNKIIIPAITSNAWFITGITSMVYLMHNTILLGRHKMQTLKMKNNKLRGFTDRIQEVNENTESFRNFVSKFRNSPITKRDYANWFRRFMDYCNLPDVKAKTGIDVGDNPDALLLDDTRKIQNLIKQFIDYEYDVRGLSPASVRTHYMAIKHFYQSNEIMLNWPIIKDYVGVTANMRRSLDMPYTYEEIHKLLDKADERERMIVLLLASSGVRRGALPELKYGDLKWIEQYQIYEITVYKGFKEEYVTYCSSECAYYINSYLDFRRRNGEQLTLDSYLIRKQFDTTNHRWTIKVSNATDPPQKHKTTMRNLESIIYHLIYDSGIRDYDEKKARLGDRHKNMAAHSFRKFFENKCLEAGIDPFYVSVLMGHKAGIGVERHYYRPTAINGENSLLELYVKKAMPYLTISDESRLKLKNRELEMRVKEQEEMRERINEETKKLALATTNQASRELWQEVMNNVKKMKEDHEKEILRMQQHQQQQQQEIEELKRQKRT